MHRNFRWYFLGFVFLILSALLYYFGRGWYVGYFGMEIKPTSEVRPVPVEYYLQSDPKWVNLKLGTSGHDMGGSGSAICAIAASLNHMGIPANPIEVARKLDSAGGIKKDGEVIWKKISRAYPQVVQTYKRDFSAQTLSDALAHGHLPIVKTKYNGVKDYHWLLLIGATKDDFLVMDPLELTRKSVPLSRHGKVYTYRMLYRME